MKTPPHKGGAAGTTNSNSNSPPTSSMLFLRQSSSSGDQQQQQQHRSTVSFDIPPGSPHSPSSAGGGGGFSPLQTFHRSALHTKSTLPKSFVTSVPSLRLAYRQWRRSALAFGILLSIVVVIFAALFFTLCLSSRKHNCCDGTHASAIRGDSNFVFVADALL
eukprot:PhM_4_TR14075/c0_g1_i1/m.60740